MGMEQRIAKTAWVQCFLAFVWFVMAPLPFAIFELTL